jgi:hypothetical protein
MIDGSPGGAQSEEQNGEADRLANAGIDSRPR